MPIRSSLRYWWLVLPQKEAFSGVFLSLSLSGLVTNLLTGLVLKLCRFNKPTDIPVIITKTAPDFCTVYVITKGKLTTKKPASRAAPSVSPLLIEIQQNNSRPQHPRLPSPATTNTRGSNKWLSFFSASLHISLLQTLSLFVSCSRETIIRLSTQVP